ncbi:LPS chain length-determining protein [Pasteurella sp. PK-2025]|uniref:LPS chain length-determining protein n=1 Tax=unclassified Pasteurella TaxID=2621516 RepID=UPI003C787F70
MTNQMENQQRKHRTFTRYVFLFFILTGLSALVAYAASFLVKKEWRAEAYVGAPTINVLGNYYSLSSMYELVSGKKNELSPTELAYREFKKQAMSHDVITQFWKNTDFYRQKQTGESVFDQQELERLSKSFGFSTEQVLNSVNGSMGDRISLTLGSPKQATELLGDFVDYVNLQTRNVVYNELIYRWKVLFDEVKKAGEFNLGNLQKNNGIVSAEDWQGKLKLMQSVNPLDDQFVAYRYFKKPTTSVNYTSPNRVLWAVIGAGIGLLMSLLIISVFSRLRKNA